jgi:class 3 adenylate cyclase
VASLLYAHAHEPVAVTGDGALDAFLSRALAKDPAERFGSGAELAAALGEALGVGEAAAAAPPTEVVETAEARLDVARRAASEGRWAEAFRVFGEVGVLEPEDLDSQAWAALFVGAAEASADLRQRAFAGYLKRGDERRAGFAALNVAMSHFGRGMPTIGAGWFEHAERYLSALVDTEEHAWLLWARAVLGAEGGADLGAALDSAALVVDTARSVGSLDVENLASLLKAQLLVRAGDAAAGARLLDQVMALAVSGCLGAFATSWVYCGTISTCASVGDFERAWAWTTEVGRCSVQPGLADFPGDCRLHRAELLRVRGQWTEAESEAARVCDDVGSWHVGHLGIAHYELGEVTLRRGDLTAAECAFAEAQELGVSAEPGLTMLHVQRGELELAASGIREALDVAVDDPCRRIPLLMTAVEVALAQHRLDWAQVCVEELDSLVLVYASPLQRARAAHAGGTWMLAAGDAERARARLRDAVRWWDEVQAPYEAARSRVALAAAHLACGDHDTHAADLNGALDVFERLGATLDAKRTAGLLGRPPRSQRVSRALMFTDVEGSTDLLAEIGDDDWIELLRWHDQQLRLLFSRYHGTEIHQKGGGDGFFVVFTTPDAALDCALSIQQLLPADGRRRLAVRIGVHWAEVTHADGDYSGRGVHEAARIAALAAGGEILTSIATLRAATNTYATGPVRTVGLRGLPGETEIAALEASPATTKEPT